MSALSGLHPGNQPSNFTFPTGPRKDFPAADPDFTPGLTDQ
jgi:hypothetical protein